MTFKIANLRKEIGNLSVAVFLNCQFLRSILSAIIPGFTAHGIRLVIIVSAVLFLVSIRRVSISSTDIIIPFVIILYYIATSVLFPGKCAVTFFEVFSYAVLPFLLAMIDVDIRIIVNWTLVLTAPAMLVANRIFVHLGNANAIKMLLSYSVLFSTSCGLSYLLYYRKCDKKARTIIYTALCFPQIYYLYEVVLYGSRGPTLSLAVLVFLILYFKPKKNDYVYRRLSTFFVTISIFVVFIIVFAEDILPWINSFFIKHNIYFRSLVKTVYLFQHSDLSHGRIDYYIPALQGFIRSPLFGQGLDMFYANTGLVYPHNFILQLAYDGGLILLFAVLGPVVTSSIRSLSERKYSLFVPWALLFSASVVGALFSGDLWMRYNLWFFFAYCIKCGKKRNIELQR